MIHTKCLDQATDYASLSFFLKLIADYNRYILEEIGRLEIIQESIGHRDESFYLTMIELKRKSIENTKYFYELAQKTA